MAHAPAAGEQPGADRNHPWALYLDCGKSGLARDEWSGLTSRLGLRGYAPSSADSLPLRFGATSLLLDVGVTAANALHEQIKGYTDVVTIGGVPAGLDEGAAIVRLELAARDDGASPAGNTLRQVQQLCCAAAILAEAVGAERLYCPSARLWSPVQTLVDAIADVEQQGIPPLLHIVAFLLRERGAGEQSAIITRGLSALAGFELALHHPANLSMTEAVRRLARLAIHSLVAGPLQSGASVAGLAPGETLTIGALEQQEDGPPFVTVVMRAG